MASKGRLLSLTLPCGDKCSVPVLRCRTVCSRTRKRRFLTASIAFGLVIQCGILYHVVTSRSIVMPLEEMGAGATKTSRSTVLLEEMKAGATTSTRSMPLEKMKAGATSSTRSMPLEKMVVSATTSG